LDVSDSVRRTVSDAEEHVNVLSERE
jgi:hypothetical protein